MKKQLSVRAISVALTILSVASCGASNGDSGNVKGSSKVDMQGAADEADKLIYQTLSTVKPPFSGPTTLRMTAVAMADPVAMEMSRAVQS